MTCCNMIRRASISCWPTLIECDHDTMMVVNGAHNAQLNQGLAQLEAFPRGGISHDVLRILDLVQHALYPPLIVHVFDHIFRNFLEARGAADSTKCLGLVELVRKLEFALPRI
ncbi:hypothetical protein AMAG_18046 [Allomyces macrogynus ATCC 38327]|uniref:Uncharacterized protein n=1 Tax=Allomyces macrogynus (strain ATCC 38327) TaxID=578462 RepID=A0A0L0S4U7_ALLM3|nr:hypothetical protein AMAG_18046 [Allomyces macrogynus ATCC 38327]|eukprot:KNE57409.1 hypothetical protein AMAG_18046 [Allomyces macrogynus ATCC 38327]